MKPILHGNLPDDLTEELVVKSLLQIDFNQEIHVFTVKLTGTKDTDLVIVTEMNGFFVLEIKGWKIDQIVKIKSDSSVELLPGIKSKGEAWLQATRSCDQFKNRISKCEIEAFWSPGVILFGIFRMDFDKHLEIHGLDNRLKQILMNATIFNNDFSSEETFIAALDRVYWHPALREAPYRRPKKMTKGDVDKLIKFYDTELIRKEITYTVYDKERLMTLLKESAKHAAEIPLGKSIYCTGYAGTGKTIFALQHAVMKNCRTLFLCFNKVLAMDITRLVDLSVSILSSLGLNQTLDKLDTYDVFEWLKILQGRGGLYLTKEHEHSAEQHAINVVQLIQNKYKDKDTNSLVGDYDLIIIDEAQDLQDWVWNLLEFVLERSVKKPVLFLIVSNEQLLYRETRSNDMDVLIEMLDCTKETRNRVFRTSNETFLISQLFVESKNNIEEAIRTWHQRFLQRYLKAKKSEKMEQTTLPNFPTLIRQGKAPKLWCINDQEWFIANPLSQNLNSLNKWMGDLIQARLASLLKNGGHPCDLLIMVPFEKGSHYRIFNWLEIAQKACENLGIQYIDYTIDKMRRVQYSPSEVRITTYHSARGIEGLHVILLGFEQIAEASSRIEWRIPHLGYIALSRSVFDTDIVYFKNIGNHEIKLLESIIELTGFSSDE